MDVMNLRKLINLLILSTLVFFNCNSDKKINKEIKKNYQTSNTGNY